MTQPDPTIRRARPGDLDALLALEALFDSDQLSRRRMRHWIHSANGLLLVASVAGDCAGYCLAIRRQGSRTARLYSVVTAPAYRGQGIARLLLASVERRLRRAGIAALRLEVAEGNAGARRLYESLGYAAFETVEDYYENGAAAVRMEKGL